MKKQIALLRGINVSGQKKILMADLKVLFEKLGCSAIQTYIQSGNIVFHSEEKNLAEKIKSAIKGKYDFDVPTLVLSLNELQRTIANNPFFTNEAEEKVLYITFLADLPQTELATALEENTFSPDEFKIIGKTVYLYCPNGYGKIKMNNNFIERKLKTQATTRNWKTVNKLVELAS